MRSSLGTQTKPGGASGDGRREMEMVDGDGDGDVEGQRGGEMEEAVLRRASAPHAFCSQ